MIDALAEFAKANHPGFGLMPIEALRRFFQVYAHSTIVVSDPAGQITGFAVYQDWPDRLVFVAACFTGSRMDNIRTMRRIVRASPKPVMWFDEQTKKVRRLWRF